jgi:hypothetical protein
MVIGCSGVRYIHRHWDIVVCRSWGVGGIVGRPLLLLLLLLWPHLLAIAPAMWLELVPVLTECVVEGSRVWESSSGSDEFNHLFPFCDVNGLFFVLVVGCGEWAPYDFIQHTWGEAVQEEANGFFVADGVASLSYQIFEV